MMIQKLTPTFIMGIVEPPRNRMVNRTMMRVVVTITYFFSRDSNSRWRLKANAIAPRKPETNYGIQNIEHNISIQCNYIQTQVTQYKLSNALTDKNICSHKQLHNIIM